RCAMSLKVEPTELQAIPEETVRVARAAFPRGSRAMQLRDHLGTVYADARFAALFAVRGRPAEAPWRLALVTVLQFAGGAVGSPGGRRGARADRLEVRACDTRSHCVSGER